jgi:hypothetical protein
MGSPEGLDSHLEREDHMLEEKKKDPINAVLQSNRSNRIYICMYRKSYYEELAHVIMEAKWSHSLPSATWRPRKNRGLTLARV